MLYNAVALLSLALVALTAPLPSQQAGRRTLLDLSPTISPVLDLSGGDGCFGVGISVCDPITVGGKKAVTNEAVTNTPAWSNTTITAPTPTTPVQEDNSDALIVISPDISPDISLDGGDGCKGVGISAVSPLNLVTLLHSTYTWNSATRST